MAVTETSVTAGGRGRVYTPDRATLVEAIDRVTYKDWKIEHGQTGSDFIRAESTVQITFMADDNFGSLPRVFAHQFSAPPGRHPVQWWVRWLLDCIIAIERHEAMEQFRVDGAVAFNPHHSLAGPYVMPPWPKGVVSGG